VPDAAFEALQARGEVGRITKEHLDASVRRNPSSKSPDWTEHQQVVDVNALNEKIRQRIVQNEAQEISDRGVTLPARHAAPFACGWHEAGGRANCCLAF